MRKLAIVIGCILYVLSPVDLIPDVFVGPGQLDDLAVVALSAWSVLAKKNEPSAN